MREIAEPRLQVMVELNAVLQRLHGSKDDPEKEIVTKAVADIRRLMSTQSKSTIELPFGFETYIASRSTARQA